MVKPELLEISFSHYCEKARWALDYHLIAFTRCSHLPLVTRVLSRWRGGFWHTVPVLFTDRDVVAGSDAIFAWAEQHGRGASLLKTQNGDGTAIKAWIALFDKKLGPATRRIVYFYILDDVPMFNTLVQTGLPTPEKILSKPFLPLLRETIRKGLKVDIAGVERSQRDLQDVWKQVEAALADGRSYLVGGEFSAADLTFAALAAPVLLPAEYGAQVPALEEFPRVAQDEMRKLRESPAGQFALRIYRDHRA